MTEKNDLPDVVNNFLKSFKEYVAHIEDREERLKVLHITIKSLAETNVLGFADNHDSR